MIIINNKDTRKDNFSVVIISMNVHLPRLEITIWVNYYYHYIISYLGTNTKGQTAH